MLIFVPWATIAPKALQTRSHALKAPSTMARDWNKRLTASTAQLAGTVPKLAWMIPVGCARRGTLTLLFFSLKIFNSSTNFCLISLLVGQYR